MFYGGTFYFSKFLMDYICMIYIEGGWLHNHCSRVSERPFVAVAFYNSTEKPMLTLGIFLKSYLLKMVWKQGENLYWPLIFFFCTSCFSLCVKLWCSVLINIVVIMLPSNVFYQSLLHIMEFYKLWFWRYCFMKIL